MKLGINLEDGAHKNTGLKTIIKKFLFYCIPILIVAVSANIYELVDNILVIFTL